MNKKNLQQAKAFRDACIENDYLPVPISNAVKGDKTTGKRPLENKWYEVAKNKKCSSNIAATNTGIALPDLYAIDVDIEDEAISKAIEDLIRVHFGPLPMKRTRSNTARFLTLFRSEGGIKKQYVSQKSGDGKVEILSDGQQFVADGWHYSGVEIEWEGGISPANFHKNNLPIISVDIMKAFLLDVKHLLNADKFTIHGFSEVKPKQITPTNRHALSNSASDEKPKTEDLKDWLINLEKEDDYDEWIQIIGAIYNTTDGSNEGFELADEWSKKSAKYDSDGMAEKWLSFETSPLKNLNGFFILKKLKEQKPDYCSPSIRNKTRHLSDNFRVLDGKLCFVIKSDEGDEYKIVSDAFDYRGKCRDSKGQGWAYLISWTDVAGIPHMEKFPFRDLGTEQTEIFQKLRDSGLMVGETKESQSLFKKFLREQDTSDIIEISKKPGWFKGAYLLQDGTKIGQSNVALDVSSESNVAGILEEWQNEIAKYASGNHHMMFSICAALAGPLLDISNLNGGGFHFFGKSQSGKTSALSIASSVSYGPQAIRTWRATDNGLESVATEFNDSCLLLDEIGEMPERGNPGETVYMLANGGGKLRMTRSGTTKESASWRLLYQSTGEHDLGAECAKKGRQVKAGILVRHADIPLDGLGITNLHGFSSSRAMVDATCV
jgi:hypothetical protein